MTHPLVISSEGNRYTFRCLCAEPVMLQVVADIPLDREQLAQLFRNGRGSLAGAGH